MADPQNIASSLFTNEYRDRKLANKHVNYRVPQGVGSVSDCPLCLLLFLDITFKAG